MRAPHGTGTPAVPESTGPEFTPQFTVATVSNRSGTVTVTATDHGQPLQIRIDQHELRYGSGPLAHAILEMCHASAAEAKVRRREDLARAGVPADILDRLGLPTRAELDQPAPTSWLRPL